jgi:hypothetical protein
MRKLANRHPRVLPFAHWERRARDEPLDAQMCFGLGIIETIATPTIAPAANPTPTMSTQWVATAVRV